MRDSYSSRWDNNIILQFISNTTNISRKTFSYLKIGFSAQSILLSGDHIFFRPSITRSTHSQNPLYFSSSISHTRLSTFTTALVLSIRKKWYHCGNVKASLSEQRPVMFSSCSWLLPGDCRLAVLNDVFARPLKKFILSQPTRSCSLSLSLSANKVPCALLSW